MAVIDDLAVVMEENKRGIQYGLYSTALFGLAIALRSVRPFKKFTTPQSLPSSFLKKHITLYGQVIEVEPNGLLKVNHFPIWPLPGQSSSLLPIQIDSIQTVGLSTAWLSTVVKGSKIKFQPIMVQDNALSCIGKNIGTQLVSIGFASVKPIHTSLDNSKLYLRYYKELLAAEDKAEKKKLGMWNDKL
ncbi:hypothetical protein FOCC_FOCC015808 [Frankliniella occidentalis]|nr:hypothetical protein FOCC_FOCC015808 [Frankliniella occidentalis]